MEYNIYCDESCHLEHDQSNAMTIGAIYCSKDKIKEINENIIHIKKKNGISKNSEVKWTKASPTNERLYIDLIDYFFHDDDLSFRCILIKDKKKLNHKVYNQTHDDWYYKMYYDMLNVIFDPRDSYNIYIDIKDTNSFNKSQNLLKIIRNSRHAFNSRIIKKIQPIRSHEVQIMQLVDIIVGAIVYTNRHFPINEKRSETKINLCNHIKNLSGYTLTQTTLLREQKINILAWEPNYYE